MSELSISWMPAALSADLPAGTVMPVESPSGAFALWRGASGRAAAFADRCPHRGMRLSHGFVRGEALSCIYHGWRYGEDGRCLRIPAHPGLAPPDAIRVEARPVAESDGILWTAAGPQAEGPPRLGGFVPLRTLTAEASMGAIETAAGAGAEASGVMEAKTAGTALRVLLAPVAQRRTLIHVLVERDCEPSRRIAASRAAEVLRREAEAVEARGGGA